MEFDYQKVKAELFNEYEDRIDFSGNIYKQAFEILTSFAKENHAKYGESEDNFYQTFELDTEDWVEEQDMKKELYGSDDEDAEWED